MDKNRLVLLPRFLKRFVSAGVLVHGVGGVLEKIRRFFIYQSIGYFI
jgi:hypothetical protein